MCDPRDLVRTVTRIVDGTHPDVRALVPVGELSIISRRHAGITVVDPIHHLHKQPLALPVPVGRYAVTLAYAKGAEHVAAAIVRFGAGAPVTVERAAWTFPFQDSRTFSLESGVAALFDHGSAKDLAVAKAEELAALLAARSQGAPAVVSLSRARWNAVVFRVETEGNGFYSCHWVRGAGGELVALVVDFAELA
jgi:hypothetical protein